MQDIRILELLIIFLVFVPLIRPFVKDLQPLDGLVWFPPLALGSNICLFPAYGFRPECIPLLLYVIILNIHNFPALIAILKRLHHDTLYYVSIGRKVFSLFSLIITGVIAFYFAPITDTALQSERIRTIRVKDEARNAELFLHVYGKEESEGLVYQPGLETRPLILIAPPVIGSITAVDKVCGALEAQGFTVISYSRRNFDSPALGEQGERYGSPLGVKFRFLQAALWGRSFEKPNTFGRIFEEERREDILFLLSYIKQDLDLGSLALITDRDTIFLAGYGPGGSALVLIGESPDFIAHNPAVKGLIAVESPLWSVYQAEERYPLEPPQEAVQWFQTIWFSIAHGFINLWPKKIAPVARVPQVGLPILFILSDRAANSQRREGPYGPILRILQTSSTAVLATVAGAGILDYSDYPEKYPLYRAFFSGTKQGPWKNSDFIEGTASLMANFASLVMASVPHDPGSRPAVLFPQKRLMEHVHFETSEGWNLPDLGYILPP